MKKLFIFYLLLALVIQGLCMSTSAESGIYFYGHDHSTNSHEVSLNDIGVTSYNYGSRLYKYFSNLTTNLGNNETNSSCGYVALAMLLNYYDTYSNDNIVEEKYEVDAEFTTNMYDVPSPGTKHELNYNPEGNDVEGYINYLRNNYVDSSLHAKLALIGINALTTTPTNLTSFNDTFGTNNAKIIQTLNLYFNMLPTQINYSITKKELALGDSMEDIKIFIMDSINNGKPVFVGHGHHAIIVYGYTQNHFIYHDGYVNRSNMVKKWPKDDGLFDDKINFALTLDFNVNHVCSHHYFNTNTGNAYCLCGTQIHKHHVYCSRYEYYSNNQHKVYCSCGIYKLDLHNFRRNFTVEDDCPCGAPNPFH